MNCRNLFNQSVFEYLREFHMHWLVILLNIVVTVNPSFASFPKPGYVQKKNTLNYGFCPSNGPFFSSFCSPVFTVSHPDRQSASLHPRWGWLINWLETSTSPWYGSVFDWCCVLGLGVSACVCVWKGRQPLQPKPHEVSLTKGWFTPLNYEVQQFSFTVNWWLVNEH